MKGTVFDLLPIMLILFIFGFVVLSVSNVATKFKTSIDASNVENPTMQLNTTYIEASQNAVNTFNYGFVFLGFGLALAAIIGASMLNVHPGFVILAIIVSVVFIILSGMLSDVFTGTASSLGVTNFPLMSLLMEKFPIFIAIVSTLIVVVLYAKSR
jgi:hypothetical protein